jgi:hypothetical protein
VADVLDAIRPEATIYGTPPVDVTAIYEPTAAYEVTALMQTDRIRPRDGKLVPTIQVAFRIPGLPSSHTILIDNYAFTHADPVAYLYERSYLIRGLYAVPEMLPPFDRSFQAAGGPIATLQSASATSQGGQPAVAWAGTVDPQSLEAVASFDLLRLPANEVYFSSDPIAVAAAAAAVPLSGLLAGVSVGSYLARLSATSARGAGVASTLPVTVR